MASICVRIKDQMKRVNEDLRLNVNDKEPRALVLLRPLLAMLGGALDVNQTENNAKSS